MLFVMSREETIVEKRKKTYRKKHFCVKKL